MTKAARRLVGTGLAMLLAAAACGGSTAGVDGGVEDGAAGGGVSDTGSGTDDTGGGEDAGGYDPVINPADFVDTIDNQYFPLVPGTIFTFQEGDSTVVTEVTADIKTILGVACVVVHDKLTDANGDLVEDTFDWYAQDKDGNVWYFGEDTREYVGGEVVSTEGTWEGGVDGAKPGIVMKGDPKVGDSYRQEYLAGHAEDQAEVLSLTEQAVAPYGTFDNCLMTKDYTELDPGIVEHKYYCPGVGQVLAVTVEGGTGREELISVTSP